MRKLHNKAEKCKNEKMHVLPKKMGSWDMLSQSIHKLVPYITFGMQFSWPKFEQLMMLKLLQSYNKNLPKKK
jgi:hypothetical protein